jgi:DNA-binding response OmpR family regulator
MSGYHDPEGLPEEPGRTEFLRKPFAPEELAAKAGRLLGRRSEN